MTNSHNNEEYGDSLRISGTVETSMIYGPGRRFVIWVQGCSLGCSGCWNVELWPAEGGHSVSVIDLLKEISKVDGIEGVTILGGEPLEQANSMLSLIRSIREMGLTVMLYSGFEEHELDDTQKDCVEFSDIVILGRYVSSLRDTSLRWRGSSNQVIKMVSDVYQGLEIEERNEVEVIVDKDGSITLLGYPSAEVRSWIQGI
jgi:anaerobic ribonucleoside-triphosphate reductase activating protein